MQNESVLGDKTIPITKISFSIPNLRNFHGERVKRIGPKGGLYSGRDRISLEDDIYKITIDKSKDFKESHDSLTQKGGYYILYAGEIEKKKGHISYEDVKDLNHCLSTFLSFLNGCRCSLLFLSGIHEDNIVWTDYTGYTTDLYNSVHSWPQKLSISGLNDLWKEFSKLWKVDSDKDFILSALHWYLEANSNSGYLEGSIVMIQTALELIYNWLIIEKKKLIIGKDGENISAANKIRLLLSNTTSDHSLPKHFKAIKAFIETNKEIYDEIDLFVQIRNAIIHSQEEKRKKLLKISNRVKYEAHQLGLWYIETSLLKILNYEGKYRNRCSGEIWAGDDEEVLS